jgi:RNA polymerase sigma factor (sigma-70 family)
VEEALIKKAIARDACAIEALYDHFAPKFLGICYRYCGNREDAEDVLHDGFIKIIRNLDKFKIRSDGSLEAWMKRIPSLISRISRTRMYSILMSDIK